MHFHRLDEVLKKVLESEKRLEESYYMLREYLENPASRKVVALLKRQQEKVLALLEHFHIHDPKKMEYIKLLPKEELVPHYDIVPTETPRKIFQKILGFEHKLEDYYKYLRHVVSHQKTKEFLDAVIQLKAGQIRQIKAYVDTYEVVYKLG